MEFMFESQEHDLIILASALHFLVPEGRNSTAFSSLLYNEYYTVERRYGIYV